MGILDFLKSGNKKEKKKKSGFSLGSFSFGGLSKSSGKSGGSGFKINKIVPSFKGLKDLQPKFLTNKVAPIAKSILPEKEMKIIEDLPIVKDIAKVIPDFDPTKMMEMNNSMSSQISKLSTALYAKTASSITDISKQLSQGQSKFGEIGKSQAFLQNQMGKSQLQITDSMKTMSSQISQSQQALSDSISRSQQSVSDSMSKMSNQISQSQTQMTATLGAYSAKMTNLGETVTKFGADLGGQLSQGFTQLADAYMGTKEAIYDGFAELGTGLTTSIDKVASGEWVSDLISNSPFGKFWKKYGVIILVVGGIVTVIVIIVVIKYVIPAVAPVAMSAMKSTPYGAVASTILENR